MVSRCQMWTSPWTSGVKLRILQSISYSLSRNTTSCGCTKSIVQHGGIALGVPPSWNPEVAVINCSSSLCAAWATHVLDSSCISVPPHVRTTSLWFTLRRLETSLDESPSLHSVTMRTRSKVAIDLLGMAELQTTREVYLLPDGMTGTDRLFYSLRHIGTVHAWLFTSLRRFSDIDEQSKGLCYWCNINIERQCSGDLGTEVIQHFFYVCISKERLNFRKIRVKNISINSLKLIWNKLLPTAANNFRVYSECKNCFS